MATQAARSLAWGGTRAGGTRRSGPRPSRAKGELELPLLGPLELRVQASGRVLPLANAKARGLLAILAWERGRVFSQEELVECLWGEELSAGTTTPEHARANLRGRIAELRHLHPALAEGITTHPAAEPGSGGYCLERSPRIRVDLEELTRHSHRGQALRQRGQFAQALPSLEKAARLWRGDFLEEEPYAEWTVKWRRVWRERHLENLTRLGERYAQCRRYRSAIECCRQILGLSPRREEAWRALMVYLYPCGPADRSP